MPGLLSTPVEPIAPAALRRRCDPGQFAFETTASLPDLLEIGQERATGAVRFGVGIHRYGYNLYALGPTGMGKHTFVRQFLEAQAADEPTPPDWCYVSSFADPQRPRALRLPAGRGAVFQHEVGRLVEELRVSIPAAFDSDDYRNRKKLIETRFTKESERPFADIEKRARERNVAVLRTPLGVGLAPARDGEVMDPDAFHRLPEAEQERVRKEMGELQEELQEAAARVPQETRKHHQALKELRREVTAFAVRHLIDELRSRYADLPDVLAHLEALQNDVVENADELLAGGGEADAVAAILSRRSPEARSIRRYEVNLLVDHSGTRGAPVAYEDHPTHANLIGRIEHLSEFGSLVTDFRLIKAGALHRANGGYLIVDARKILQQPLAWDELKRALRSRQIRIESLGQAIGLVTTASMDPEPIPLDVKVVLVGERILYYLLAELDPDFLELFKVAADFDEAVDRTAETEQLYARLLGTIARRERLRPLDRSAAAHAVEHGSRLAGDGQKLSVHMENLADLLREADHLAGAAGRAVLAGADIEQAIDAQVHRSDRVRDRIQEEIDRGTILLDTSGATTGQLNGLSVLQLGGFAFGRPSRITARVRLGGGEVVDIEREVELGGRLHSKGVLILAGFLGARYAPERPLSLRASLVFEQSYAGVEGDSASCAELLALLSALADVPLAQYLAVTGSVNQRGEVQAIGGVNEKIEGFFDVCKARGLTGRQGVLIPVSNVPHLMLRDEVVAAVSAGGFQVFPIATVDQAIELLTGMPAGEREPGGAFPAGTFNDKVEARLAAFAEQARAFRRPPAAATKQ
jgi:lon-related putative ATP-dependent protease